MKHSYHDMRMAAESVISWCAMVVLALGAVAMAVVAIKMLFERVIQ
jgi:hypothetical protein